MLSGGFTDAPVSRSLVFGLIASSILVSITDSKHFFWIQIDPHFWRYGQFWRALSYQLCYANSGETLFACILLYHLRCIERMWGSRKYLSFIIVSYLLTSLLTPTLLAILSLLTRSTINYLPAGPTPLLFALLAQFHAAIPHIYKYRLALFSSPSKDPPATPAAENAAALTFTDKSYTYILAFQLALIQLPGSTLGALVGWVIGYMWRNEILPGSMVHWRAPAWMVGAKQGRKSEFAGLRRRLETEGREGAEGSSSGLDTGRGGVEQRRSMLGQVWGQLSGGR